MPIEPHTERQQKMIVNNIVRAVKNIDSLNKTGYNFLYLCSGFIAHYNLFGFKDFYSEISLRNDILRFADQNQWRNFHPGEDNYEYMMSKRDIYNAIVAAIR